MTLVTERFHAFLEEQEIYSFDDLLIILITEPYCIEITENSKYPDLVMLNVTEDTDMSIEITNIFNGLIISKVYYNNIICYSGNVIEFLGEDDLNRFNFNLKNLKFHLIGDGETIRLFYYNDEWIISSNYHISADDHKSNGSDEISVEDIFKSCCRNINFNYKKLNKRRTYVFGLYHHLNRNVIQHVGTSIAHLETFNDSHNKVNEDIGLPVNLEATFKNLLNLIETCKCSEYTTPGFIIENTETNKKYKVLTEKFLYVSILKGEETDPIKKYIALNRDGLLNEYLNYFKEDETIFGVLEKMFDCYVDYFYKSYVDVKIRRIEKTADKYMRHEKDIINKIHTMYLDTRVNTSKEAVASVLKYYDEEKLIEILRSNNN